MSKKPFSLLIKPASADCNLRCQYCFYLDRCGLYPDSRTHRMSLQTLEKLTASYLETDQPSYTFGWQGGEPTLMGLEFFEQAVAFQKTYRREGAHINNGLQTNGTLLNERWARFLSRNRFLTGISLDGPEALHDRYRISAQGTGSYRKVVEAVSLCQEYRAEFNILTLVSQVNVQHPLEVYRFLRDELQCYYHQYIECIEFDSSGHLLDFAITGSQWGDFLCTIFDEWVNNDTNRVSVRLFDSIITTMLNNTPTMCSFGRDCRHYLVVEHNGDVYPCDFYVEDEMSLGNIEVQNWSDLLASRKYEEFGSRKKRWGAECSTCSYVEICAGDCQKNRLTRGSAPYSKSVLCEGWHQFYAHSMPKFRKLVKKLENKRIENSQNSSSPGTIGRNDPCPCGSGRKYKKCCMNS